MLSGGHLSCSTPTLVNQVFIDLTLSCWHRFGLGPVIPVKVIHNATTHKGILSIVTVILTVVFFLGVMFSCPHTFGHIVYISFSLTNTQPWLQQECKHTHTVCFDVWDYGMNTNKDSIS